MQFMKSLLLTLLIIFTASADILAAGGRNVSSFDKDWLFIQDDELTGAEVIDFDDSDWTEVNLPHDWSIEGGVDRDSPTGRGGGFMPCGIAWYRKAFTLSEADKDRKVFIDFDGIMANSDVWVNGKHLGHRPFGYVSMQYDISDMVNYTGENIIAVKTDTYDQPASRWYTGAGIYRHTRLVITDYVYFDNWGVFIKTPEVRTGKATLQIDNAIVNETCSDVDVVVKTNILSPAGSTAASLQGTGVIKANAKGAVTLSGIIDNPQIWDIDSPQLYKAVSSIYIDGEKVDEVENTFGLRSFEFKADSGFWLNGKNIKIKGVCLHHDAGALGAAVPKRVLQRRFEKLKEIGVNGIRTAHNPMSPEFLDLCDEMGFVVMNEVFDTWRATKNHADYGYQQFFDEWWYADNRDTVMRDRNHPSIVIFSVGNEIRDNLDSEKGFKTFKAIYDATRKYDPTRPITQGVFRPNHSNLYNNGYVEMMDVVGQNYREGELVQAHLDKPSRKVIGTENGHSRQAWLAMRDNPFMAGQFLWTGIDYLGEADWPDICWSNACINRIGTIRPMGYQRQSWWATEPVVHIARREVASGGASSSIGGGEIVSHWTPRDYDTYDEAAVEIYSNCETVELFLNGESLGEKKVPADASPAKWDLHFKPGTLKAVGKNDGKEAAVYETTSVGKPVAIKIEADREVVTNDFDDISHVRITFVDENGLQNPWTEKPLKFEISGPGKIAAFDNGDPQYHDSFRGKKCRTYHGECMVFVAATGDEGEIKLKVSSRGFASETITLKAAPAK